MKLIYGLGWADTYKCIHIHIHIYMCVCVCVYTYYTYIYIYIYIYMYTGMNFLAAVLLLQMKDEEAAFWTLAVRLSVFVFV